MHGAGGRDDAPGYMDMALAALRSERKMGAIIPVEQERMR